MDKYVIRAKDSSDVVCDDQLGLSSSRPKIRSSGFSKKRPLQAAYEIYGRLLPSYKRSLLKLMLGSYSEVGSFLQSYPISELSRHVISTGTTTLRPGGGGYDSLLGYGTQARGSRFTNYMKRPYVSCIDFDLKGIYLASVNSTGCLSIHEFETLYCSAGKGSIEDSASFIGYISTDKALEAVRWNPANQDEVACVAAGSNKVYFYDIACDSFLPSEVLKVKSNGEIAGFHDLSICKLGSSRVLACGKDGNVHIWDRRASKLSYAALPVPCVAGALNSIQLSNDEQVVYAGSEGGFIHAWDLRGGTRSTAAFVTCGEVYHQPFGAIKVASVLSSISSLKAQTEIGASAVHAISLDSSCGHRLAFHLNNGWSGVLDMTTIDVTHLHCPPPPWLDGMVDQADSIAGITRDISATWTTSGPVIRRRRPVWVPSYSVYAVGSASEPQIHMLDFTHGPKSRYSIQYDGSDSDLNEGQWQVELPTSEAVVCLATHPLNDQLVAGTQGGKLLLLGQKKTSFEKEGVGSQSLKEGFSHPLNHDRNMPTC